MHCFSMQIVMNKCFLINPKKNCRRSVLSFSINSENDVTEPKAGIVMTS